MKEITIDGQPIGREHPTYFIADISANHDGSLERAKSLIQLAKEAGADAAKFQNFDAPQIVSRVGFETLGGKQSHQESWEKSVFEVYEDASIPGDWTPELKAHCDDVGIHYFSTPYDFGAVDHLDPFVPAFKIGSGDITWTEMLKKIASKRKPVLLATGASTAGEVQAAADTILAVHPELVLMQCNTNYTGSLDNFRHIHLSVLRTFGAMYPDLPLGLSDHTPGHATVLGAVALGACVIEKHFTDDTSRVGPDHPFSMTPTTWREMVDRTRELELAMGSGVKRVADNEQDTVVVQRRSVRCARNLPAGHLLSRDDLEILRPAPRNAISPDDLELVLDKVLLAPVQSGQALTWHMLAEPSK